MDNYYKILGVGYNSNKTQIKKNYLRLIKSIHPDTYKGNKSFAEKKCAQLNVAYAVLIKDLSRSAYDRRLKHHLKIQGFSAVNKPITKHQAAQKTQTKQMGTKKVKPRGLSFAGLSGKQELSRAEIWLLRITIVILFGIVVILFQALSNASN